MTTKVNNVESMSPRTKYSKENVSSQNDLHQMSMQSKLGVQNDPMTYKEWLKHKDAERRLKRKLISTAQDDVRSLLLNLANEEQQTKTNRV